MSTERFLHHTDGSTGYLGRIWLTDPADGEGALLDWRAPAARPFYCATLASPLGVTRRRHFQLAGTAPESGSPIYTTTCWTATPIPDPRRTRPCWPGRS